MGREVTTGDKLRIVDIQKLRAMYIKHGCLGERVVVTKLFEKHPTRGRIIGFKFCDRNTTEAYIHWQCPIDAFEFIEEES